MADLHISLSAVKSFRRCEQQYYYTYVMRLAPKIKAPPLELGSLIHRYLETYYKGIQSGKDSDLAHEQAIADIDEQYSTRLRGLRNTARIMGALEIAEVFDSMLPKAERICRRYYATHGKADAERYEILQVEQELRARVAPGIISNGVADLVVRDRLTNAVLLWEHKTTTSVPSHGYRLRDLQIVLYIAKLRKAGLHVRNVLWNYILTTEPKQPKLTQTGRMAKLANLTTNWETYKAALIEANLDPTDYADMEQKYASAEADVFFPRFEYIHRAEEQIILEDYRTTARSMLSAREDWTGDTRKPVRVTDYTCDRCDFVKLCTAVLTGADSEMIINRDFFVQEERQQRR